MPLDDEIAVHALPVLASLAQEFRAAVLREARIERFPAGTRLITEGATAEYLHILMEGSVEIFSQHRNRETTLAVLQPPEEFVLAAVILDRPYIKSARSAAVCRVLMLPAARVREAFARDGEFARWVARNLATTYRDLVREINNYKLRFGIERLANWLLCYDEVSGSQGTFNLPCEKRQLAGMLGMSPEALSRIFVATRNYGVAISGRTVIIEDRVKLERLAGAPPAESDLEAR